MSKSEPQAIQITGTPDRPNFKRHPVALVLSLIAYAAFMAALIVWAIQLHRSHL